MIIGGATLAVYLAVWQLSGDYGRAQTAAVTMLAFGQLAFLFSARILTGSSFTLRAFTGNRTAWGAAAALVVLQIVFVFAPFMNSLFDSTPIGAVEWGLVLVFAVGVFVLAEAAKAMARATAALSVLGAA